MSIALIVFTEGNYEHGIACYMEAKAWVVRSGLFTRRNIGGLIRSPRFRGQDIAGNTVPEEWIEQSGWQCAIEIYFEPSFDLLDPEACIKALPLPPNSTLQFP